MKIIQQGTVTAARDQTDLSSCCFPCICVLDTGRWLVSFRAGPAKASRTQRAVLTYSDDEGKTWSEPREIAKEVRNQNRPGTWRSLACTALGGNNVLGVLAWDDNTNPFRPMFNETTEGLTDMKLYITLSRDGGKTFSKPRLVDAKPFDRVPTPITGAAIVMPNGQWAVQFEVNKHYHDLTPWRHSSAITHTSDGGKTWGPAVIIHSDPKRRLFCWDQRLAVLRDGSVLDLFWTFDQKTASYLNIHARSSKDSGKTWGKLWDIGVPGQPARAVSLPDGRILMPYVDRTSTPTIKARLSTDNARTWLDNTEITIHKPQTPKQTRSKKTMQDAWAEMSQFSIGLPDAVALPNGDVLIVYYAGPRRDLTNIQFARVRA